MSSEYPMLDNKPIDQLKVTELKEELRRRKMPIRGLKEELVKRLFEAIEMERESEPANDEEKESENDEKEAVSDGELNNGFNPDSDTQETANIEVEPVAQDTEAAGDEEEKMVEGKTLKDDDNGAESEAVSQGVKDEDGDLSLNASLDGSADEPAGDAALMGKNETCNDNLVAQIDTGAEDLSSDVKHEDAKPLAEDSTCSPLEPNNQVPEVSQDLGFNIECESISTDSASINEKNKLKDNLNADNFHLELEVVKTEMVPSSDSVPPVGDVSTLVDENGSDKDQTSLVEMDAVYATSVELNKKDDSVEGGSPEKLDLDRSSGDELMDEDVPESKHIESNIKFDELDEGGEVKEVHADVFSPDRKVVLEEEAKPTSSSENKKLEVDGGAFVDVMADGFSPDKKEIITEEKVRLTSSEKRKLEGSQFSSSEKRKLEDHEVKTNDTSKRQRRWNPETVKISELQPSNTFSSTTPKDSFKPIPKHVFARSDSSLSADSPKERVVPPSPKVATNSLRIDRFVRPFTLKAVQELLGKTGTVCNFWMDHIKTHCYVTYSSAEEAAATRNAVYNLQWPPNGGRFLVAEFVDPQEVTKRLEAPPQAPAPINPSSTTPSAPSVHQPQTPKFSQQNSLRQKLPPPPPLPLPPPPPLSELPRAREQLPLPPPPPPPAQSDPETSIVTLDDLFKKTKTTPRLYYLPLTEEQVASKLAAQREFAAQRELAAQKKSSAV